MVQGGPKRNNNDKSPIYDENIGEQYDVLHKKRPHLDQQHKDDTYAHAVNTNEGNTYDSTTTVMAKKTGNEKMELKNATYDAVTKENMYDQGGYDEFNRQGVRPDENAYDSTTSHAGQMETNLYDVTNAPNSNKGQPNENMYDLTSDKSRGKGQIDANLYDVTSSDANMYDVTNTVTRGKGDVDTNVYDQTTPVSNEYSDSSHYDHAGVGGNKQSNDVYDQV